jgi:hypothetical protein
VIPFFGTLGFPGQGGVKKVEVSAFIFTFREEESFVYLMGRGRGATKRLHVPSVLFDPLTDSVPDPVDSAIASCRQFLDFPLGSIRGIEIWRGSSPGKDSRSLIDCAISPDSFVLPLAFPISSGASVDSLPPKGGWFLVSESLSFAKDLGSDRLHSRLARALNSWKGMPRVSLDSDNSISDGEGSDADSPYRFGKRAQFGRMRLHNRGIHAFQFQAPARQLAAGDINWLHAFSVTEGSSLQSYIPAVRRFLRFCADFEFDVTWIPLRDLALADHLSWLLYSEDESISSGRNAVFGCTCVFPELIDNVPLTLRALKSWSRLEITGEGEATTWEAVAAIADFMACSGDVEAAEVTVVSADMYLRASDWSKILHQDVIGESEIAVVLGVPERGESAKTGVRQGVRPDRDYVSDILRRRRRATRHGERIFKIAPQAFREAWARAAAALRLRVGPPHTLRHVGPSHDAFHNYRNLDRIRERGRWKVKSSVLRYSKTHALIAAAARVPHEVAERGRLALLKLGPRPAVAKI